MQSFRITKYNPAYRDDCGKYLKDEWTSMSDIGRMYENKEFTINEYYATESKYVDAILGFMRSLNLNKLEVASLEKNYSYKDDVSCYEKKYKDFYPKDMEQVFTKASNGVSLNFFEVEFLARLILREHIWCKLEIENVMYVHFGHDYYMYVGTNSDCAKELEGIKKSGLYVEEYDSPYSNTDED